MNFPSIPVPAWLDDIACGSADPEAFFTQGGGDNYALARAICRTCPVAMACLEQALADEGDSARNTRFGFRGGMTPEDRFGLWRRRNKYAKPKEAS